MAKDARVDSYISEAEPFARPILTHLRKIVHQGCPKVEETIKWKFPHFDHQGVMCSMAAFKAHCAFGFWKAELIFGDQKEAREAMGHFGRITSVADLPDEKKLLAYVRKAAELNEAGVKRPRTKPGSKPPLPMPADLSAALQKNARAKGHFDGFPPSQKREYIEWITEAKREETRNKRLKAAVEWMAEGKIRNWKHL